MEIIKKIINNIEVTLIKTNKFKSIAGTLYFNAPITKENLTYDYFISNILFENTKKYSSKSILNRKCLELYNPLLHSVISRTGNYVSNDYFFENFEDRYTEPDNFAKTIDLFLEIIFNPNIKNNSFDIETFNLCKKKLLAEYDRRIENQTVLANKKILKYLNQHKSYSIDINRKLIENLTPDILYKEYIKMLNNSNVKLSIIGNIDIDDVNILKIVNKFNKNNNFDKTLIIKNDDETELKEVKEKSTGEQNVLEMIYYLKNLNEFENKYVIKIFNIILGSDASSRLFTNIREKKSLAYYINSFFYKDDNIIKILTGIEKENYEKTVKLIKEEVSKMNNITEKELNDAKTKIKTNFYYYLDDTFNIIEFYKDKETYDIPDIDLYIENIDKVKIEDVQNLVSKIQLGLIYFLEGSDISE